MRLPEQQLHERRQLVRRDLRDGGEDAQGGAQRAGGARAGPFQPGGQRARLWARQQEVYPATPTRLPSQTPLPLPALTPQVVAQSPRTGGAYRPSPQADRHPQTPSQSRPEAGPDTKRGGRVRECGCQTPRDTVRADGCSVSQALPEPGGSCLWWRRTSGQTPCVHGPIAFRRWSGEAAGAHPVSHLRPESLCSLAWKRQEAPSTRR